MSWTIGAWSILKEGRVHQSLKKCLNIVLASDADVNIDSPTLVQEVSDDRTVYEAIRTYEGKYGAKALLDMLSEGLKITCKGGDGSVINFTVLFRTPSASQEQANLYREMIAEWVESDPMMFTDRFFRLPKITEDMAARYLGNPLAKSLKQAFGFGFQYKIIIERENGNPGLEPLRKKLYGALNKGS